MPVVMAAKFPENFFTILICVPDSAYRRKEKLKQNGLIHLFLIITPKIVAFTFSIGACFGKIAVQHSDPIFFSVIYSFLLSLFLFLVISFRTKQFFSKAISRPVPFLLIDALVTIMMITHVKAINLVEVSYMISVKRLSILFGVIYGVMFFKETNVKERFLGATVMVSGIIMITVF